MTSNLILDSERKPIALRELDLLIVDDVPFNVLSL